MDKKLFVVCPFSTMEAFIRSKYGEDVFFLTCSGAVLQGQDLEYMKEVNSLIIREKITSIYFVNDTSCCFLNSVIRDDRPFGLHSERIIRGLYRDNYQKDFEGKSLFQQQVKLAELNLKNQMQEITDSPILDCPESAHRIRIKGLIVSKNRDMVVEISNQQKNNKIYEF